MSDEGTEDLPRPDRAGYVIDEAPDMVTIDQDGKKIHIPAIQIWVGKQPKPNGYPVPASLKRYMERMGGKGFAIICRFDEREAMVSAIYNGKWSHQAMEANITHAPADIAAVWREKGLA